ncbi:energy-coupling factor transport system ATP-binding protein [Streptomyces zhaozhouensis]|uniref:Energy-coupling factor transport system ATP-binding protein n=1 Tax=Streptomyces zhaozhouensis TaxID=1300267 RepID=A0A286DXC9_9ACTN|nr:ATP-binding cassette domain-containing protein [Streptomyces zhaozhouensis]SOD63312.1 energy-coupling factor transport system ATP-binding protein [Streptomyces zhaozhouensis]
MIDFDEVTFHYPDATRPALRDVRLHLPEGELCLVAGRTGVGKSTLLGAVNGLVPRFTGGRLAGRVTVAGQSTEERPPQEFASLVGVVGQDPLAGFVTDTVEEELAYAMEQLAVPPEVMRKRVEETLDLLGIAELRHRALRTLSGGQQQRVAIGSVFTTHPQVLVLDEPTSALDPTAAEEVLAAVLRLVHDLGTTVVIAEHRMERVLQYADRLLYLPGDGTVRDGAPRELLPEMEVAPPVVELGRVAGWSPPPLSVRDARRHAPALRRRLAERPPPPPAARPAAPAALAARGVSVAYGRKVAVREVDLDLFGGEVTALMGRNGAGKSSLLWALQGSGPRRAGTLSVAGEDPGEREPAEARELVGLVPQSAADLLYLQTVAAECAQADAESSAAPGRCRALLERMAPGVEDAAHPRDLSEGQRLALVLAIQLTCQPRVLLLDEPTRGLDYDAKRAFGALVRELTADGDRTVMIATHDVEFVAATADRVVVLAEGDLVADGPTAEVVCSSPSFAPQVAKVLRPEPWLTVDQVRGALNGTGVVS